MNDMHAKDVRYFLETCSIDDLYTSLKGLILRCPSCDGLVYDILDRIEDDEDRRAAQTAADEEADCRRRWDREGL